MDELIAESDGNVIEVEEEPSQDPFSHAEPSLGPDNDEQEPDIESLPPALRSHYQKLQAGYTKKFQKLSEDRRDLEAKAHRAAEIEAIFNDPQKLKLFISTVQANNHELFAPNQHAQTPLPWDGVDPNESFQPDVLKAVQATSYQVLQQVLTPVLQQFAAAKRELDELRGGWSKHQITSEWGDAAKGIANADEFKDKALALRQQAPSLTLKQALHAVGGDSLRKAPAEKDSGNPPSNPADKRRSVLTTIGAPAANGKASVGRRSTVDLVRETMQELGTSFDFSS